MICRRKQGDLERTRLGIVHQRTPLRGAVLSKTGPNLALLLVAPIRIVIDAAMVEDQAGRRKHDAYRHL
jgi:hypothetical protein